MTRSWRHFSAARSEPGSNRRCSTLKKTARSRSNSNWRSCASFSITRLPPVSCHRRSKASAGPSWRVVILVASPLSKAGGRAAGAGERVAGGYLGCIAVIEAGEHDSSGSETGAGAQQAVDFAARHEVVDAAEGGNHGLPRLAVDALILDDLEVFGFAGKLASEEHGGSKPRAP